MPIIKSAKKRVKVTKKATIRNAKTKRNLREAIKSLQQAIKSGAKADITKAKVKVESAIDTAAKKNVIHKNKAARKKSQVAKLVKAKTDEKAKPKAKTTKKAAPKKTTK